MENNDFLPAKILKRIALVVFIIAIAGMVLFSGIFIINVFPVDANSTKVIEFELESGWSQNKVANELKKQGLIKNPLIFKIYLKITNIDSFLAGTYLLSPNMDVLTIASNLEKGHSQKPNANEIKFIEGKRFVDYAKKISEMFPYTEDEIIAFASDVNYLKSLIDEYWFIDESILNKDLYYPLEGYIFADTYTFKKDSTIKEILAKMLDQTGAKLKIYEEDIKLSGMNIHSLLTLASMVELEAVTPEDRIMVAGVFKNRIDKNDFLGSDVTTYYAEKKKIGDVLSKRELNACNAYNTRGTCFKGLPVGPICSPSYSSISAAINPEKTENYYFVADTESKLYFAKTYTEHMKNVSYLKEIGKMPK